MTQSLFVKVFIIYLGISILLFAGGVRFTDAITGDAFQVLVSSTNPNASIVDDDVQYNIGTISTVGPNVNDQTGVVSTGVTFIDVLRSVRDFVRLILNVLLAIPALFFYFPPAVQLFIGVPLGVLAFIGMIFFVRSGT